MYFVNFFQRGHQGINCILVREIWSDLRKLAETIWGTSSSPKTKTLLLFLQGVPLQKVGKWKQSVFFWVQYRTPCIYFYILIWSESKDEMACALQHYIAVGLFQPFFFFLLALLVIENRIAWCDWWHSLAQRAFWKLINFSTHSVLLCPHLWPWKIFTIHKSTPCFTFLFKSVTRGSCTDCLKSKVALLYFRTTL